MADVISAVAQVIIALCAVAMFLLVRVARPPLKPKPAASRVMKRSAAALLG